jgi:hypothetical protein
VDSAVDIRGSIRLATSDLWEISPLSTQKAYRGQHVVEGSTGLLAQAVVHRSERILPALAPGCHDVFSGLVRAEQ